MVVGVKSRSGVNKFSQLITDRRTSFRYLFDPDYDRGSIRGLIRDLALDGNLPVDRVRVESTRKGPASRRIRVPILRCLSSR